MLGRSETEHLTFLDWASSAWPRVGTAEPLLYFMTWLAAIHVVLVDLSFDESRHQHPLGEGWMHGLWPEIGLPGFMGYAWTFLMLTSPVQAASAWLLLKFGGGHRKVWGMWQRLGGDTGLFLGLATFVVARLAFYRLDPPDSPLFGLIVIAGVAMFTGTLVVRDILALYALRTMTNLVYELENGG